jgi:hypothetical protein
MNGERTAVLAFNASDVHVEQVDQDLARAGRVCFHGGSLSVGLDTKQNCRAPAFLFRPLSLLHSRHWTPRISDETL